MGPNFYIYFVFYSFLIFIIYLLITEIDALYLLWQAVDAVDNGINQYYIDATPKYFINTYLSSRVGRLNLSWTDPDQSAERENDAFQKAMALAGSEFLEVKLFVALCCVVILINFLVSFFIL